MSAPDIRMPGDVTPDWLTAVLRAGGVDADVRAFTAKPVGTGQIGDSVRFALDYARAGAEAPRSLVGKFPAAGEESRSAGVTLGNYMREVRFYQHLAATALIHTPRVYFTDVNDAHEFVLMMEDLSPATQGDQLAGVSLAQAHLVMQEAAKLHASHWQDDALDAFAWVNGAKAAPASPLAPEILHPLWAGFCDRYGARVTPAAKKVGEAICAGIAVYGARGGPRCLTHNDFRPDNMMFGTPSGGHPITTLDWQSIGFGTGATDVAYFLGGAITSAERRTHEAALVDAYLAKLSALGVSGYARADFMHDYAFGSFQLFLTAFFAAMVVTQTARGDEMFFQMLNGATAQIGDHGAVGLLG